MRTRILGTTAILPNVRDCVYVCTTARWPVPWELGCEFVSELSASSESNRIANVCENKIL